MSLLKELKKNWKNEVILDILDTINWLRPDDEEESKSYKLDIEYESKVEDEAEKELKRLLNLCTCNVKFNEIEEEER